jgi:hypothetical protein
MRTPALWNKAIKITVYSLNVEAREACCETAQMGRHTGIKIGLILFGLQTKTFMRFGRCV